MLNKEHFQSKMILYEFGIYLDGFSLREVPKTRHDYKLLVEQINAFPVSAVYGTGQPCMLFYCFEINGEKAKERFLSLLISNLEDAIRYNKIQRIIKDR